MKLLEPLLFQNGPEKQITVIFVLFYSSVLENCQISTWSSGIASIFGHQCLST